MHVRRGGLARTDRRPPRPAAGQASFDELGTPLAEATFVVVDLVTHRRVTDRCRDQPSSAAVKVRGGPGARRVTDAGPSWGVHPAVHRRADRHHRRDGRHRAPARGGALPASSMFLGEAVVVATTRRSTCRSCAWRASAPANLARQPGRPTRSGWPARWSPATRPPTACCPRSRRCSAPRPRPRTGPCRRARHRRRAARADRAGRQPRGALGRRSWRRSRRGCAAVTTAMRLLADDLPPVPGVYVFEDDAGRPLYIGKATNLRARVSHLLHRLQSCARGMARMVALATRVRPIPCTTPLVAGGPRAAADSPCTSRASTVRSRHPERMVCSSSRYEAFTPLSLGAPGP